VKQVAYPISYATKPCPPSLTRDVPVQGLVCGTLTVPEDRSKPHGRSVRLDVLRAPPRETPTGDPVLDFGADTLTTSPARDHSEEIQLAQRGVTGTPSSDPALTCPGYAKIAPDALTKPSGDLNELRRDVAAIHACYESWTRAGVDLNQYNYLTEGDDMADLIRALHFTRVHLVSGYVGTISALEVIRQLPGVVRSLTLQEPVAPGQSAYTNPAGYLSAAFNNYVLLCRAAPACNTTFPDLARQYRRDHDHAQTTPRLVQATDSTGRRHAVLLDGDRITQALANALSNQTDYGLIAATIAAPLGDQTAETVAAGSALDANDMLLDRNAGWGAILSEECSYEAYTIDQAGSAITRHTFPQFAKRDDLSLQQFCPAWPVHRLGQIAFDDPTSTVPTLIVTPTLQPGSDPQWADIFQRGFPNATVMTFATLDGHLLGTSDPRCFAAIRVAFLANPNKPISGTSNCEKQTTPIQFLGSANG
jgi:pimeloyl-ACP methyl ester carboxylesterase